MQVTQRRHQLAIQSDLLLALTQGSSQRIAIGSVSTTAGKRDLAGMGLQVVVAHRKHQARLYAFAEAHQHGSRPALAGTKQLRHVRVIPARSGRRRRQWQQRGNHTVDHDRRRNGKTCCITRRRSAWVITRQRPISSPVR
jgi:hypothetical protein